MLKVILGNTYILKVILSNTIIMKQRISLTVDKEIIDKVDRLVDGLYVKSRSDFVEKILKKHIEQDNTAVILCGGSNFYLQGTQIPRPLVDVVGKRIIEYTIDVLRKYGFVNLFILGSRDMLQRVSKVMEGQKGINIMYLVEGTPSGSASILLNLKKYVHARFLVIPGDCLFNFDLEDMLEFHKTHNKLATIAIHAFDKPRREHYNLAWVKLKGINLIDYREMPSEEVEKNTMHGTGIYLFEPSVLNYIGKELRKFDLGNLTTLLIDDKQINGYMVHGYWFNIHTNDDVREANQFLKATQQT